MKGDQFAPYEPPYKKFWRERLDGEKLTAAIAAQQRKRADKELDKVVAQIKKGKLPKKKKPPLGGCG